MFTDIKLAEAALDHPGALDYFGYQTALRSKRAFGGPAVVIPWRHRVCSATATATAADNLAAADRTQADRHRADQRKHRVGRSSGRDLLQNLPDDEVSEP